MFNNNFKSNNQRVKMKIQQRSIASEDLKEGESSEESIMEKQEQAYNPNQSRKRKIEFRKKGKKILKGETFNRSLWTLKENLAYKQFLQAKGSLFSQDREGRKVLKINVLMSKAVVTRSADQCRSHHQKMMKYHRSISQIIEHIEGLSQHNDAVDENETLVRTPNNIFQAQLIDFTQNQGFIRFQCQEKDPIEQLFIFTQ